MVLYKRKPIEYPENPVELEAYASMDSVPLWEIKDTGEVFIRYEDYLARREFYLQRHFSCEITGRTGLNFFDALESELTTTREIKTSFPKALRRPILRHVHFSTIPRLEQLVSLVYDTFKQDYFPSEHVICTSQDGERVEGIIREKVTFPEKRRPDGSILFPSFSKYTVQIKSEDPHGQQEDFFETKDVTRDRRFFSKHLIRSFLKNALTKEAWHGAPWQVKDSLAIECDLPVQIPPHLQQSARIAEKKAMKKAHLEQQRHAEQSMFTITDFRQHPNGRKGPPVSGLTGPPIMHQPWQSKPPGGKPKTKFIQHNFEVQFPPGHDIDWRHYPIQYPHNGNGEVQGFVMYPQDGSYGNGAAYQHVTKLPTHRKDKAMSPPEPPQIKYPIEDIDVPPKDTDTQRPKLKKFTESPPGQDLDGNYVTGKYDEKSVGSLLEVWNTLNVHNEVFILDSFTFDDLAEALCFSSNDVECELLSEIHCAVLKQLVSDKGDLMVDLPKFAASEEEDSEEEEESEEEDDEEDPSPEPEPEPPRRTTRGSLAKAEALAMANARSPTPDAVVIHRAAELQSENPWRERCKERDFRGNSWQPIMACLLYQVSLNEWMKERCEKLLSQLLPADMEPSDETVIEQYARLNANLRLDALEIITMLAVRTKAIREHLEKMSLEMTDLRKKKIEQQRLKKDLIDQLQELNLQRKEVAAEIGAKLPLEEKVELKEEEDTPMPDILETNGKHDSEHESEDEAPRTLRRGQDRANERKRKREEQQARKEKEKKEKAAANKLSKQEIKLKKVQDQMTNKKDEIKECEDQIADLNNDLRETDCQRTKCLGRDRFCNRYYWFERNGMPFGGVPDTSTAHYGYANGRVWVQGPDPMELTGFLELVKDDETRYKAAYGVTPTERKEKEEGETHLEDALHWGYIDDAESIDGLIAWLDERGLRERALRKELQSWRDIIVECMQKLKTHLKEDEVRRANTEAEVPTMRISTRTKTYVDLDTTKWSCVAWQNTMAVNTFGLKHSEGLKKSRRKAEPKPKIVLDKKGKAKSRR